MPTDDMDLVRRYARNQSERAFETLVSRHLDMVYSVALRQVGDAHLAEEVTQAVFIVLARKANSLGPKTVLSGWLYRTACYAASDALKMQRRRQRREQEAFMQSSLENSPMEEIWREMFPLLDEAMLRLRPVDRDAIVLRYFQNKTLEEVGAALGLEESAAQKRVARSLERLRAFFARRGVVLTTTLVAGAFSAGSIQAAPVGLAGSVTAAAAKSVAVSSSTLALSKGVLKVMAWSKAKAAAAIGMSAVLAVGTTAVVVDRTTNLFHNHELRWVDDPASWVLNGELLKTRQSALVLRPTQFANSGSISLIERAMGVNASITNLISAAYGCSVGRIIVPDDLPRVNYDYMVTPPFTLWQPLRDKITTDLGLTVRTEIREMDVLSLKVKVPRAPGIKNSAQMDANTIAGPGDTQMLGGTMATFGSAHEGRLRLPVVDHTGLTGPFDISLRWKPSQDPAEDASRIKQAFLEQLGLELIPTREPIEVLVVERLRK